MIPSNISTSCTTFLNTLNADNTLASCVTPLIEATASFSPAVESSLSQTNITSTLSTICKSAAAANSTTGCSDGVIRSWLAQFYQNCQAELTDAVNYSTAVRELYDLLYVVNPLQAAVCAKNSGTQKYCVLEIVASAANVTANATATANGTTLVSFAAVDGWNPVAFAAEHFYILTKTSTSLARRVLSYVVSRQDASETESAGAANATSPNATLADTLIQPNVTTYKTTNLPFLFLQPTMSAAQLCTPCTRAVLVAYVKWEARQPYALGLSQSPILGGQLALWNAIEKTCGSAFTQAVTTEAGVLAAGNTTSAAASPAGVAKGAVVLAVAAGAAHLWL